MKEPQSHSPFISIEQAIEEFSNGQFLILLDDEDRENEGDLIIAADKVTPDSINFITQYGRGLVCMPMGPEITDRLGLRMMVENNTSPHGTPFTVSIGAKQGMSTGISTQDRAHTVKVAIDPCSTSEDLSYPGHIFPLRAHKDGVLARPGHTEASIDLARLAGLTPAAVLCEVLKDDGSMARQSDLIEVGKRHGISLVSIADLITYRNTHEGLLVESASALLPLKYSDKPAHIKVFRSSLNGSEHVALIFGNLLEQETPLVRIHSQCLTGDVFGSVKCDCGEQLAIALEKISQTGGVLLYLNQEGRGIGLTNKIKSYALQETGMDTVEANSSLGFSPDLRDYGLASNMLKLLGIKKVRLITNNPKKIEGLSKYHIEVVSREPIEVALTPENSKYLVTKRDKLGHLLSRLL